MARLPFLRFSPILWVAMFSLNQPIFCEQPNQKSTDDEVRVVAKSVLAAIQKIDVKFLSKVADPNGITLGFDSDPIDANRFRTELLQKRGAYCVIFDTSCLQVHKSSTAFSLRQALANKKTTLSISEVQGSQEERVIAVKSLTNPNEVLFSFFLRHTDGEWVLQQIEYF